MPTLISEKPTAKKLAAILKGFYKNPISIEIKSEIDNPDAYLTVTFLAKKNWRKLV